MSMYLSNADLRPTGFEPAEFIDAPVLEREALSDLTGPRLPSPARDDRAAP